jgi:putative FmdB family regulatory protein
MPIYEYACSACGKTIDVLQKVSDPTPARCKECGAESTLSRVVSRSSFHLKGGGWYADLYGSSKKDGGSSSSSSSASSSSSSSSPASTSTASSTSTSDSGSSSAPSGGASTAPATSAPKS